MPKIPTYTPANPLTGTEEFVAEQGTTVKVTANQIKDFAEGAQGYQGDQGPQGDQGDPGTPGADSTVAGPQGFQGFQGDQGDQGDTGADSTVAGPQGDQGDQGVPGGSANWRGSWSSIVSYIVDDMVENNGSTYIATSPNTNSEPPNANWNLVAQKGDQGDQGATGNTGSIGVQGYQGVAGAQGDQGDQGTPGTAGSAGLPGSPGPQGDQGPQGWAGPQGTSGVKGDQGDQGDQGNQGNQGATGASSNVPGPQGDQGDQGDQGYQGTAGGSASWKGPWSNVTAYIIDDMVENNGSTYIATSPNTNSEPPSANWNLVAQKGDQGDQGADGSGGGTSDHTQLTNIGTNTHAQIDTHIADINKHIDWTLATEDFLTFGTVFANYVVPTLAIAQGSNTGYLELSGSTAVNTGANLLLFAENATGNQNDIQFRSASTIELEFDFSANEWDFQANNIVTTGDINGTNFTATGTVNANSVIASSFVGPATQLSITSTGATTTYPLVSTTVGPADGVASTDSALTYDASNNKLTTGGFVISENKGLTASSTNNSTFISGGNSTGTGSTVEFYGSGHATQAYDIEFKSGGTDELIFDYSANEWDFNNNKIVQTSTLSTGAIYHNLDNSALLLNGGDPTSGGASIWLYGSQHVSNPYDIDITAPDTQLFFDSSAGEWDFQDNDIACYNITGVSLHGLSNRSAVTVAGSNALTANGAALQLFAELATGRSNEIEFSAAGGVVLNHGNTAATWDFQNQDLLTSGDFIVTSMGAIRRENDAGTLRICGDMVYTDGSSLALYGSSTPNTGDVRFYAAGTVSLEYDASVTTWDFQANEITTTGDITTTGIVSGTSTGLSLFGSAAAGIAPASGGGTTNYLRADGTWAEPPRSDSFVTQTVVDIDSGYTWADTGSAIADNQAATLTWVSGDGIDLDVDATNDAIRVTNTFITANDIQGGQINISAASPTKGVFVDDGDTLVLGCEVLGDWSFWEYYYTVSPTFHRFYLNDTLEMDLTATGLDVKNGSITAAGGFNGDLTGQVYFGSTTSGTNYIALGNGSVTGITKDIVQDNGLWFSSDSDVLNSPSYRVSSTNGIYRAIPSSYTSISGGSSAVLGANISLYGQTHSTQAYDVEFKSDTAVELHFDADLNSGTWDFQANNITTTGVISGTSTGLSLFGTSAVGVVPASGGGTTNYLRADGTWAAPPGGSSSDSFTTHTVTDTDSGYTWAETGSAVASSATDTLTWVSGNGIDLDVDATNDAVRVQVIESEISHANISGVVANQHIDWTTDQGATNIHSGNYTNTTYVNSDWDHNQLTNYAPNEHIDWTSTSSNLSTSGSVSATAGFTGDLTGTADIADQITVSTAGTSDYNILFSAGAAGTRTVYAESGFEYDGLISRLKVPGSIQCNGSLINDDLTSSMIIAGGNSTLSGANIVLYGPNATGQEEDIEFKTGTTLQCRYDDSVSEWDFRANNITTTGDIAARYITSTGGLIKANSYSPHTGDCAIKIGEGRTANGYSYVDLVGDATYTGYGLRLIRNNTGANAGSTLAHRGTGDLSIWAEDAGGLVFGTSGSERMKVTSGGIVAIARPSPESLAKLDVGGRIYNDSQHIIRGVGTDASLIEIGTGRSGNGNAYIDIISDTTYTDYGLRIIRDNAGANASSQIIHRGTGEFQLKAVEAANIVLNAEDTSGEVHAEIDNVAKFKVTNTTINMPGLPTSATGLNSGDLWIDTANGRVLKVVA